MVPTEPNEKTKKKRQKYTPSGFKPDPTKTAEENRKARKKLYSARDKERLTTLIQEVHAQEHPSIHTSKEEFDFAGSNKVTFAKSVIGYKQEHKEEKTEAERHIHWVKNMSKRLAMDGLSRVNNINGTHIL